MALHGIKNRLDIDTSARISGRPATLPFQVGESVTGLCLGRHSSNVLQLIKWASTSLIPQQMSSSTHSHPPPPLAHATEVPPADLFGLQRRHCCIDHHRLHANTLKVMQCKSVVLRPKMEHGVSSFPGAVQRTVNESVEPFLGSRLVGSMFSRRSQVREFRATESLPSVVRG